MLSGDSDNRKLIVTCNPSENNQRRPTKPHSNRVAGEILYEGDVLFVAGIELLVGNNDHAVGEDHVGVEHFDVGGGGVRLSLGCDCSGWAFGARLGECWGGRSYLDSVD